MNKLVKIEATQLDEVVKNSGLAIQEGDEIKKSYLPFLSQLVEIQSQASKINFDLPTETDEMIARKLRLETVKIRTGSMALKDERKRTYLLRGNLEQASYNLIKASCELTEDVFFKVEKAREIAEKAHREQLKITRSEKLIAYLPAETIALYPLGEMTDEQFTQLFDGMKKAHEEKIEAERKAEEDRIAKEKAEKAEQERIRQENERLKKEAEIKAKELEAEREKIRKDNEEKERLAEIERKKQAQILKDQQEKAAKERADLLAKAEAEKKLRDADFEKERKEKERIAKELQAAGEAIAKAKRDQELKIEAEKKAKAAAEKKSRLAPDRDKLLAFGQALNNTPRPEIKSIEAIPIMAAINGMLVRLNGYIVENANKL